MIPGGKNLFFAKNGKIWLTKYYNILNFFGQPLRFSQICCKISWKILTPPPKIFLLLPCLCSFFRRKITILGHEQKCCRFYKCFSFSLLLGNHLLRINMQQILLPCTCSLHLPASLLQMVNNSLPKMWLILHLIALSTSLSFAWWTIFWEFKCNKYYI